MFYALGAHRALRCPKDVAADLAADAVVGWLGGVSDRDLRVILCARNKEHSELLREAVLGRVRAWVAPKPRKEAAAEKGSRKVKEVPAKVPKGTKSWRNG